MDWKGEANLGDSDVLRDLHLEIKKFASNPESGDGGKNSEVPLMPKGTGVPKEIVFSHELEAPEKSIREICMGSELAQPKVVSQ